MTAPHSFVRLVNRRLRKRHSSLAAERLNASLNLAMGLQIIE